MGHHGMDEPSPEMQKAMRDKMKAAKEEVMFEKMVKADAPEFGATGQFPDGSIDKSDEGEIKFGITSHRGKVIMNFGKPVAWLGMDAHQAAALAALLLKHASTCRDIGDENKSEADAKEHAG